MNRSVIKTEMLGMGSSILKSYAIIFFSQNRLLGAALLAITLLAPRFGLMGLAGVSIAYVTARVIGFERELIQKGVYLFNSLLVSLALAYLQNYQPLSWPALLTLLGAASMITLFASVFLNDALSRQYGLPALSLPFVWIGFALFFLFFSYTSTPVVSTPPQYLMAEPGWMPTIATGFFQALGAIFFLPHTGIGILIFALLLFWSRLAVLYAVVGYTAGVSLMAALGMDIVPSALTYAGFNYIFCAIALGGIFFIPSRSTLLLAILGAFFCVACAVAVKTFLQFFGIPPLALPLNLVILLVIYVMRCRVQTKRLFSTPFTPERPEQNFRRFYTDAKRFPDLDLPHLYLPFFGERTITQGVNGKYTHRGDWREALDFEAMDDSGFRFAAEPSTLENNLIFDTPVLAPCSGIVIKVIDDVPDNKLGDINTDRNWGNTIILQADSGFFITLSHLKQGSIDCFVGQRVVYGQIIGRCGSSGRSPIPHLHIQVQRTGQLGDRTVPFRVSQFLTLEGDRKKYTSTGLPRENDRIMPVVIDEQVGACFEFGENVWRYEMKGETETIRCHINIQGDYELESIEHHARMTARVRENTFYALDFRGGSNSVLFYFWIGLSRVPFLRDRQAYWTDRMDLRPLLRPWAAAGLDLVGPFTQYPLSDLTCRMSYTENATLTVHTTLTNPTPGLLLKEPGPDTIDLFMNTDGIQGARIKEKGTTFEIVRGK